MNSDPHHMILGLSKSQDAILLHILFSDYYLIYLLFDKPIFSKHQNIGTVFLPTVSYFKGLNVLLMYLHEPMNPYPGVGFLWVRNFQPIENVENVILKANYAI